MDKKSPITRWFRADPNATPRQKLLRRSIVLIAGTAIVLTGIIIAPIPGPGFTVLGPIGLGILATEFVWARRAMTRLEASELSVRAVTDKFAVRVSRWVVAPTVAGFWVGTWWLSGHSGVEPLIIWAASFPAFVPVAYFSLRIIVVRTELYAADRIPPGGEFGGPLPHSESAAEDRVTASCYHPPAQAAALDELRELGTLCE